MFVYCLNTMPVPVREANDLITPFVSTLCDGIVLPSGVEMFTALGCKYLVRPCRDRMHRTPPSTHLPTRNETRLPDATWW